MHGTFKSPSPIVRISFQATRTVHAWIAWLNLCLACRRERRQLRQLEDAQLKDIGLSRADVERECRRWLWDGGPWR